jgi:predicted metal-dependent peptidase
MSNDSRHPAFTEIKTAMLLHVPFFASLLLDIMKIWIGDLIAKGVMPPGMKATMATDGKTIWMDEQFIKELPIENSVFAVCHEIGHTMFEHMARAKRYVDLGFDGQKFIPLLWNIAADFYINDLLVKSGVGKIKLDADGKPEWLLDPKYTCQMAVEDIYRDLIKNGMPKSCTGDGDGQMDGHIFDLSDISDAELKRAIATAADTAKAMGKLPAELERFAEEILAAQVTWQELLRTTIVTTTARDTNSWARPHRRRLVGQGVYLARPASYGCDTIVWIWDTSGSIGQAEMNIFGSECQDIIRTCHPERVILIGCDSRIASVEEFTGDQEIDWSKTEVKGGGGTDFRPPFDWLEEQGIIPDACIYFTDLQGPGPSDEPGYPVIWCSTTPELKGPTGTTIYVDLEPAK